MLFFLRKDTLIGLMLALTALVVYGLTLSPAVNTLDGGELAASAATLGVAHPTGYPLFTLLGRVAAMLPFGGSVILKLNALTAIFGAAAVFCFYHLFLLLLSATASGANSRRGSPHKMDGPAMPERVAAATAALTFAFTRTYWQQSIAYEVYSLHLVFISLILWLFFRILRESGAQSHGHWLLLAYVCGLSFTNHMMTIALLPACAFMLATEWRRGPPPVLRIVGCAAFFAAGLSVYAYLPVRAALDPVMNWGNPSNLENFHWHITGRQFWTHMFYSWELAEWKFGLFKDAFASEFGYAPLAAALGGLWLIFKADRRLFLFATLLFVACVAYSINYGITDIESYFLLAYVPVMLAAAFGIRALLRKIRIGFRRQIIAGACVGLALFPLALHYRAVDLSGEYAAQDYCRNVLESADSGGVVITDIDARVTMIGFYLQWVEGLRPDVVLIDKGYLPYPYYASQLEKNHPWLAGQLQALAPNGNFNLPIDSASFSNKLQGFVARNHDIRPIYFTNRIHPGFFPGYNAMPTGLLFRLHGDSLPPLGTPRDFSFHAFPRRNEDIDQIREAYALAYFNQGAYRLWRGDRNNGIPYLRKALTLKPYFPQAAEMLRYAEDNP